MDLLQKIQTNSNIAEGFFESRIGGRSENQDSYGAMDTPLGLVITVCDGMGGGPGGKTASQTAVTEIIKGITEADNSETNKNILIKAIRRANMAILHKGEEIPDLKGMGSTCTVLLINETSATIAHVGDSRIYQLRGNKKIYRTFDHSMVFDLVKNKVITEEQARLSVQSNVITRALGIKPDVEVEVDELPYEKDDRFMLCTDGIHGAIEEKQLIKLATEKNRSLGSITDNLATRIDGIGLKEGGGHDNLTLAMIQTKTNSKLKEKMSKRIKIILLTAIAISIFSITANIVLLSNNTKTEDKIHKIISTYTQEKKTMNDSTVYKKLDSLLKSYNLPQE